MQIKFLTITMRPNKQKLVNSRCRKYNGHTTQKISHTVLQEKIILSLCSLHTQPYIHNVLQQDTCHEIVRRNGGVAPHIYHFTEVSGQLHILATFLHKKKAHSHCSKVGRTHSKSRPCGRDKNSCPCQKLNLSSSLQPGLSLTELHCGCSQYCNINTKHFYCKSIHLASEIQYNTIDTRRIYLYKYK